MERSKKTKDDYRIVEAISTVKFVLFTNYQFAVEVKEELDKYGIWTYLKVDEHDNIIIMNMMTNEAVNHIIVENVIKTHLKCAQAKTP